MEDYKKDIDQFYITEKKKLEPKEAFKFINSIISSFITSVKDPSIADIGCATGDFIYFLKGLYPTATFDGYDIDELLLDTARKEVPDANFNKIDITDGATMPGKKYDAVFMNGLNGAFESPYSWLPNFASLIKNTGKGYVFGLFNPFDIDVIVRACKSDYFEESNFYSYWNCISQKTILRVLDKNNCSGIFHEFKIGIDIPFNPENPYRSWTFKLEDGSRAIINGTQVLHKLYVLEITPFGGN